MTSAQPPIEDLAEALRAAHPELETIRAAAVAPVYAVGGAVRDLLLGRSGGDVDLVVLGDAPALAERLGGGIASHERFGTATVEIGGRAVDLATARTETYARPGALPEVEPATDIETDLARRDFTINAMAIPVGEAEAVLIDPHGGRGDLAAGLLRVLHEGSFDEDPTRAIRAARYASRLGLVPETETEELLREADLGTVSAERRDAELRRLAAEPDALRGFVLLAEWGVLPVPREGIELAGAVLALLEAPPWKGTVAAADAALAALEGAHGRPAALAAALPKRPSEAVELARGCDPVTLAVARALGAEWLDDYLAEHRHVALEIDGDDLIDAGVPRGPAVGRGLDAALRAKLDGDAAGAGAELAVALAAARDH
jgi:tRNA nucleotidyltransferase (CCA-adding enzyme)